VANNSKTFSHRLSGFAVFLITMSALSPALSVFVLGGEVLKLAGTGAAIAFIAGFFIAVIWSMIYAELGSAFPHAGGEYAGISRVFWARRLDFLIWSPRSQPSPRRRP
jgi:amino acid transporter